MERTVYDFGHVKKVAYLNTDGDCVIFRSYVLQSGKVIEKIYECAITKLDAEIALEIFKENAGDL